MQTPQFSCTQDASFIVVRIILSPHSKISEAEFDILSPEGYIDNTKYSQFTFYCSPYYLRLTFPCRVVKKSERARADQEQHASHNDHGRATTVLFSGLTENKGERATYDVGAGVLSVWLPKSVEGEHCPDLDIPSRLLTTTHQRAMQARSAASSGSPQHANSNNKKRALVQEITHKKGEQSAVDHQGDEADEVDTGDDDDAMEEDTEYRQKLATKGSLTTASDSSTLTRYGFDNKFYNYFGVLDEDSDVEDDDDHFKARSVEKITNMSSSETAIHRGGGVGIVDIPDPDRTPAAMRAEIRESDEEARFDESEIVTCMLQIDGAEDDTSTVPARSEYYAALGIGDWERYVPGYVKAFEQALATERLPVKRYVSSFSPQFDAQQTQNTKETSEEAPPVRNNSEQQIHDQHGETAAWKESSHVPSQNAVPLSSLDSDASGVLEVWRGNVGMMQEVDTTYETPALDSSVVALPADFCGVTARTAHEANRRGLLAAPARSVQVRWSSTELATLMRVQQNLLRKRKSRILLASMSHGMSDAVYSSGSDDDHGAPEDDGAATTHKIQRMLLGNAEVCANRTLLSRSSKRRLRRTSFASPLLIDLLSVTVFDTITTEGEGSSESVWTTAKLSPSLSWLDPPTTIREAVVAFCRRVLVFSICPHFRLCLRVFRDVGLLLLSGRAAVIQVLLRLKDIFDHSDGGKHAISFLWLNPLLEFLMSEDQGYVEHFFQIVATVLHGVIAGTAAGDWDSENKNMFTLLRKQQLKEYEGGSPEELSSLIDSYYQRCIYHPNATPSWQAADGRGAGSLGLLSLRLPFSN